MSEAREEPEPPPGSSGSPEILRELEVLREALERALQREPGEANPAELRPLLELPLPPPRKCRYLDARRLLRENLRLDPGGPPVGLGELRTALSILEKYGRNLLQPRPPPHWRSVRFGNPVFRATVGAIRGGRRVLRQLGYRCRVGEGLSFPPGAPPPLPPVMAALTSDIMVLRGELDTLLANQHPNPQFFDEILAEGPLASDALPVGDEDEDEDDLATPPASDPPGGRGWACASCTFHNPPSSVLCGACERPRLSRRPLPLPDTPPDLTVPLPAPPASLPAPPAPLPGATAPLPGPPVTLPACPVTLPAPLPVQRPIPADPRPVSPLPAAATPPKGPQTALPGDPHPVSTLPAAATPSKGPQRVLPVDPHPVSTLPGAATPTTGPQRVLPVDLHPVSLLPAAAPPSKGPQTAPPVAPAALPGDPHPVTTLPAAATPSKGPQTALPVAPAALPGDPHPGAPLPAVAAPTKAPPGALPAAATPRKGTERTLPVSGLPATPTSGPSPEVERQRRLREEGLRLVGLVRAAELRGLPVESAAVPGGWLWGEGLEELATGQTGSQTGGTGSQTGGTGSQTGGTGKGSLGPFSLREAAKARARSWANPPLAPSALRGHRRAQLRVLASLGFVDPGASASALYQNGGGLWGALGDLQREKLLGFQRRQWDPSQCSQSQPRPPSRLRSLLLDTNIECPGCGAGFSLARGGCIHLQCSQCQHQFCSSCRRPFWPKGGCPIPGCSLRGSLHGHHPRDCLFYLRDWDTARLLQLLTLGGVPFETEPPPGIPPVPGGGCWVPEQKESGAGLRDEACGRETEAGTAGTCRAHYAEYLVLLINERGLDPAPLYEGPEVLAAAERHLPAGRPPQGPGESPARYHQRLRDLLARECPLGPRQTHSA